MMAKGGYQYVNVQIITVTMQQAMRIVQERQAILIVWKNIMKNYVKSFRK